jgi:hypothetical protein
MAARARPAAATWPVLASKRPRRQGKMTSWQAFSANRPLATAECNSKGIPFLKERSLNVVENKGPLSKTQGRSLNVYENKGT